MWQLLTIFPQNMANQLFALVDWLHLVMYPVVVRAVLQDHGLFCPSNWIRARGAWVTQHPPVHHLKNVVLGFHGWDETVPQGSVCLVMVSIFIFLLALFFPAIFFFPSSVFCFLGTVFFSHFFFPPPLTPSYFGELLLSPQPTYCPSSYQPTYLPHPANPSPPTSFCTHLHRQSFQTRESLSSSEL
jgi:hypothetical protein